MGYWSYFPRYVSVAERRRKALAQAQRMTKKNGRCEPVLISGRTIATSWWGRCWNENLERYADFENRIGRGRSYVRNGMVLDLKIEKETIKGVVAGSRATPYQVEVKTKALGKPAWKHLVENATGRIGSMEALLEGRFPEELKELFFLRESGLFPKPSEISFDCSCPDWASMCKHVAAVLYGVGARLDSSPALFFTLRGVSMEELLGQVAKKETDSLLSKQAVKSARIMEASAEYGSGLGALFGISLDTGAAEVSPKPQRRKAAGRTKAVSLAQGKSERSGRSEKPNKASQTPASKAGKPLKKKTQVKRISSKAGKKPSSGKVKVGKVKKKLKP